MPDSTTIQLETQLQTAVDEIVGDDIGREGFREILTAENLVNAWQQLCPRLHDWLLRALFDGGRCNENLIRLTDWCDFDVAQALACAISLFPMTISARMDNFVKTLAALFAFETLTRLKCHVQMSGDLGIPAGGEARPRGMG